MGIKVNSLEEINPDSTYRYEMFPNGRNEGYKIRDINYGVKWVRIPSKNDPRLVVKMIHEGIETGLEFFEKFGNYPAKISSSSDGPWDEGCTGLVRTVAEGNKLPDVYHFRLFKNQNGTFYSFGNKFQLIWNTIPTDSVFSKVNPRLRRCIAQFRRDECRMPDFVEGSYSLKMGLTTISIEGKDTQIF